MFQISCPKLLISRWWMSGWFSISFFLLQKYFFIHIWWKMHNILSHVCQSLVLFFHGCLHQTILYAHWNILFILLLFKIYLSYTVQYPMSLSASSFVLSLLCLEAWSLLHACLYASDQHFKQAIFQNSY